MKSARFLALSFAASVSSALLMGQAHAQIYKYVDPVTGMVEFSNQPKKGATLLERVDTLSEVPTKNIKRSSAVSAATVQASFRERSVQLMPGMDAAAVEQLLGKPTKTGSKTYGSATKEPWHGVSWIYETPQGRFEVIYQSDHAVLKVNGWSWK